MLELKQKPKDQEAWERFSALGLPSSRSETYRYVRLGALYKQAFHLPTTQLPNILPQPGRLVFVNGAYCASLSSLPKPLIALPLSQAMHTYRSFLQPRMKKQLEEEHDPFALLNRAYCQEGLFLYIPPKVECEIPLKIVHICDPVEQPTLISPRFYLFAGHSSAAKFLILQSLDMPQLWMNHFIDCALEENASLSFTSVSQQHEQAHHMLHFRATLKQSSRLRALSVTNGGATSREDYLIRLLGEESDVSLLGLWGLEQARQHHVHVFVDHQAPHTTSMQKFKGILADHARSSFEGKIYVHPLAQKTEAYQMNNHLVLGKRATANSKPNLEIFADDVKASHGATIGCLDEEQLFYLTTRGIPKEAATRLLMRGFSGEILDQIDDASLKEEALRLFQ